MITCSSWCHYLKNTIHEDSEQLLHYSCNSRVSDSARTCTRDFSAFQGLTACTWLIIHKVSKRVNLAYPGGDETGAKDTAPQLLFFIQITQECKMHHRRGNRGGANFYLTHPFQTYSLWTMCFAIELRMREWMELYHVQHQARWIIAAKSVTMIELL